MSVHRHRLALRTTLPIEFIDITAQVREWVASTGIEEGLLTVMSPHTTARITLNELEAELQKDMQHFLERIAPHDAHYGHNLDTVDDRPNAHAHLLGLFMTASETIPLNKGDLDIGSWQSLFFVELDGPRAAREVVLHLMAAN